MVEKVVETYQVAYALLLRAAQSFVEIVTASKKEQRLGSLWATRPARC